MEPSERFDGEAKDAELNDQRETEPHDAQRAEQIEQAGEDPSRR